MERRTGLGKWEVHRALEPCAMRFFACMDDAPAYDPGGYGNGLLPRGVSRLPARVATGGVRGAGRHGFVAGVSFASGPCGFGASAACAGAGAATTGFGASGIGGRATGCRRGAAGGSAGFTGGGISGLAA